MGEDTPQLRILKRILRRCGYCEDTMHYTEGLEQDALPTESSTPVEGILIKGKRLEHEWPIGWERLLRTRSGGCFDDSTVKPTISACSTVVFW